MNANNLKFIACVSMLIDHAGFLLFPEQVWMRSIGRLAMPLFGFFIAEGARHTKNRMRYFLRTFLLGIACQAVYAAEEILNGGISSVYLNILFTLSFAMLICFAYSDFEKSLKTRDIKEIFCRVLIFVFSIAAVIAFEIFCTHSRMLVGIPISFDYGAAGAILPLFAMLASDRRKQVLCFGVGLVFFVLALGSAPGNILFALFDIPILLFYNGERGSRKFKYAFYIFYPLHLGALYLVDMII